MPGWLAAWIFATAVCTAAPDPIPPAPLPPEQPTETEKAEETTPARHETPAAERTEKVTVTADRPLSAASEDEVRERDLRLRPLSSPSDVLRVVPGLVIAQHAGGGKADQIFLRGFDADHGTDVAVLVDGVPNNLVSHAHGQGYADLHWVIPETLAGVEARKGTYFAEYGDFGTAGTVDLVTRDRFDAASVRAEAGSFGTARVLATGSPRVGAFETVLAAEGYRSDGPFLDPQGLRRLNLFAKLRGSPTPTTDFTLLATVYDGSWNASGQIPARAVEAGTLPRFGAVDPSEGGDSRRFSLVGSVVWRPSDLVTRSLELFVVDYSLDLFSNFTFFATDPVHGDGIEQVDHRRYAGGRFTQRWVVPGEGAVWETLAGGNLRFDDADVSLYHQERRDRLDTVNDARVRQGSVGVFVQEQATFGRLRAVAGLRYDAFRFDVASHLPAGSGTVESGVTDEVILQPKASLIADLREGEELFLNYGVGFHSNDARATVLNDGGVPALPRAVGYEIGWRWRASSGRVDLGASLWRLDLQNELVYVGDEGGTEVRGPSRREGIEIEMRGRIAPWLWGDLDAAFSRANLSETGDPVPLAPRRLISAGLTLRTPGGWSGSLRARHLGDRPAIEDESFTAEGYTVVDARAAWEHGPLEYWLNIENLTNSDFREAQFFNESRLPSEPAPVGDIHFTPGNSRNYRFGVAYRF